MSIKNTILTFCLLVGFSFCCSAQIFWTEDFTSSCVSGCQLPFTSPNGTWTWVSTGTNGAGANTWFVSQTETGMGRGQCGTSGSDASLHVGNIAGSPCSALCPGGDCGAAYDACSGSPSVVANARATSPVINCTGKSTITLSFNYIMRGQPGHDYATVWYYNGSIWSLLASPGTTALCGSQGKWTNYTVALPASANNNANVQIGFNWQNDADNKGSDPSFAADSVTLSAPVSSPPVANFSSVDSTICVGDSVHFIDKSANSPTSWSWTFNGGSPATSTQQNPVVYYGTIGTYTVKEVVKNANGKDSLTKTSYIHVVAGPTVTIADTTPICAGQTTTIVASGGTFYNWSTGATTSSITVSPATTTTYTLGVSNGSCIKDTSVKITVNPLPTVTITGSGVICAGTPDMITATGGTSYKWNTGATTSSITVSPTSTTTYSVAVSNGTCTKDTSFNVTVNPSPVIKLTGNLSICIGDSTVLADTANGGFTYSWNTGATTSSISVKPATTTVYILRVFEGLCSTSDTITVTVNTKPVPVISSGDTICQGTSVNLSASGGATYTWAPPTGLSSTTVSTPTATPNTTTEYTVTIANGGCIAKDSVLIVVHSFFASACCNATIVKGDSAPLLATPGFTYSWTPSSSLSCSTCPNPEASPTVTTVYYVTITDINGCSIVDTLIIYVKENCGTVFIPNAFSPNNDGQNDVLYVRCNPACISGFEFSIYDRWGNRMFITNDPSVGWDGRYKGQLMNSGTYVYYINYTDQNQDTKKSKGNITLVR